MMGWKIGLLVLLSLFIFIFIRTLLFKKQTAPIAKKEMLPLPKDKLIDGLQKMIQYPTISSVYEAEENTKIFIAFQTLLIDLFPLVHQHCERKLIPPRGILYRWKGKSNTSPVVFMSHYDVVAVDMDSWSVDPFAGVKNKNYLYGRGTIDTKNTLNGILQAAEYLLETGYIPQQDIYFSFAGDEEVSGASAPNIVKYLQEQDIHPSMVIDEGGVITEGVLPTLSKKAALIGIAEKGSLDLKLSLKDKGGHASTPVFPSLAYRMAKVIARLEKKPMPFQLSFPIKKMFYELGPYTSFFYRMVFSNLWFTKYFLALIGKKRGKYLHAFLRTSFAFTKMEASKGLNVLPTSIQINVNTRILGKDTMDDVIKYIVKIAKEPDLQIEKIQGMNPCLESTIDNNEWKKVTEAIHEVWPSTIVAPYLMVAASDSRHFRTICPAVYRFSAIHLTAEERNTIHGNDERISFENIVNTTEFFIHLMKKC
jgi:carboxypeptidase PM20D1